MDRMRRGHEEQQKGGDFVGFESGETLVYIHPPCREGDEWEPTSGRNYIPIVVHYNVGKNKGMAVSLDAEKNPIIEHPWVKKLLKAQKKRIVGDDPMSKALTDGTISGEDADESRAQTRFLWGMTPLKHRASSKDAWRDLPAKPGSAFIGKQIFDGIMEVFFDNDDITDPDAAILVRVKKSGEKRTTKYEVKAEPATLKEAFKVPKTLRKALATAMAEGGDCDLFRIAANMIKGTAEVQAMIDGIAVSREPDDEDDEDEKPAKKPAKTAAKTAKKPPPPEDEDEDEGDEDETPTPPAKPAKSAKKPAPPPPEDDDEDEDEDEDEDDEDDEDEVPAKPAKTAAKPAAAARSKKAPQPEDDDEDEDEDDDPPPPPPKKSKTAAPPAKPAKTGKTKPEEDDEDEELGDLEDALADLEDDDEPPAKPSKKPKK